MKRPRAKPAKSKQDGSKPIKKARIASECLNSQIKSPSHNAKPSKSSLKTSQEKIQPNRKPEPSTVPSAVASARSNSKEKPLNSSIPSLVRSSASPPDSITVVVGTYEHILYGLNLPLCPASPNPTFTTLFHFVAHPSPINVLAIPPHPANPVLASSAADSPLTLWSLSKRRCVGTLSCGVLAHDAGGAGREPGVKTARFDRSGKILVVGDETGGMTVYRTRDWALVRKFSGSGKGRVNDLAIEPQKGRLMLSVGQDRCLRMWDLSGGKDKGKAMASVRLGTEAEGLSWSPSGKKIAVITGAVVTVYDTMMTPLFTFTSPRGRVHDAKFFIDTRSQEYLILSCEDSVARIFSLGESSVNSETEPQCVAELTGHSNRVKSVEVVHFGSEQDLTYAVTISSDGFIHAYELLSETWDGAPNPIGLEPITKYDTGGCRLTCLAAVAVSRNNSSNKEQVIQESDEENPLDDDNEEEEQDESGIDLDANGEQLTLSQSDGSS